MRQIRFIPLIVLLITGCAQSGEWVEPVVTEIPNPAASGGRYPFVASGGGNSVMLLWLEPDDDHTGADSTALVWASFDSNRWSAPELIGKSEKFFVNWADFPALTGIDETPVAAHWLQEVPGGSYAYHVNMAFRSQSGAWSDPITPHEDRSATEHGFVSMIPIDGDRVFAIWLDGYRMEGAGHGVSSNQGHDGKADLSTAMTLRSVMVHRDGSRGEEMEVDSAVCDCCQTSAARSGDRIIAVYRNRTSGEVRDIYRAVYDLDENHWSEPAVLSEEGWEIAGCPVNGPQIAAFGDTVIATWFSAANDEPRSYMAVSRDGGLTFGEPEPLDAGESIGRVGVTFSREGTALLTWIGAGQETSALYGRLWRDSGLESPFVIGEIDGSRASGFPRAAALDAGFLVAWTETDAESTIQTVVISQATE